jgi:hypothetical protein
MKKQIMKKTTMLMTLFLVLIATFSNAQEVLENKNDSSEYVVTQNDGNEINGRIVKNNPQELIIKTEDGRYVSIPQYRIKKITKLDPNATDPDVEDLFATRYFITTNGLPIKKGEHYAQLNLWGGDFQFGVGDNLGVGIMTSWIGAPLIGTIKKSWIINDHAQFAAGALVGTMSWFGWDKAGALPYATLSFGDRSKNVAISGGLGGVTGENRYGVRSSSGTVLMSVAGMVKVSRTVSIILDSFVVIPEPDLTVALIMPGVRWHKKRGEAFQFGFAGIITSEGSVPVPIPMVQWYYSLK